MQKQNLGAIRGYAGGGFIDGLKSMVGMGPKETVTEKFARQDAEFKAKHPERFQTPSEQPISAENAISGYAGMTALQKREKAAGLKAGGMVKKCVTGGKIAGPGGPTDDMVPIMASNGEFMIKSSSAKILGEDVLEALNDLGNEPKNPKDDAAEDAKEGEDSEAMKCGGKVRKMAIGGRVKPNDNSAPGSQYSVTGSQYSTATPAEQATRLEEEATQKQKDEQFIAHSQAQAEQDAKQMEADMKQRMNKAADAQQAQAEDGAAPSGGTGSAPSFQQGMAQAQSNLASAQSSAQSGALQQGMAKAQSNLGSAPSLPPSSTAPQDPRLTGAPSGFMAAGGMVRKMFTGGPVEEFNPAKDSQKANYQAAGDAAYGYLPGESVLGKAGRNISNMASSAAGLLRKTANPEQQWIQPTTQSPATSVQNTPVAAPVPATAGAGQGMASVQDRSVNPYATTPPTRGPAAPTAALNDPYSNAGIIAANPAGAVRKTVDANGRTSYSGGNVSGTVGFTDADGKALAGGPKGGFVMANPNPRGMVRNKHQLESELLQRQMTAQDEYLAAGDDPVKLKAAEHKLMVLNGKQKDQLDEYAYAPGGQVVIDGQLVTQPGVIFNKRTGQPQVGQGVQQSAATPANGVHAPTTKADYDKLPKGAQYTHPDGSTRTKG